MDVIHPIQKYTMDEKRIAEKFGSQICILAGFDVQQTIPFGTPEDVRKEVRNLLDAYQRDDVRLMLTMGNNSTEDWKLESLQALMRRRSVMEGCLKNGYSVLGLRCSEAAIMR